MTAPPPTEFPLALLGLRFVSEDGKLYFVVRQSASTGDDAGRFPLEVEVGRPSTREPLLSAAPARFRPREDEDAREARRRLDRVEVELGIPDVGETWQLMFTRPTDDRSRWNGFDWVALRPDTPPEEVAVFPEHGGTPYGGDGWDWQEGWWYPYSTFHLER